MNTEEPFDAYRVPRRTTFPAPSLSEEGVTAALRDYVDSQREPEQTLVTQAIENHEAPVVVVPDAVTSRDAAHSAVNAALNIRG
ncbi:MAG TPA: hypothetical protein VLE73_01965 [Candidatus Saccharimonadales bacterium]|nr:hypothetical protein [Candidatus Saccharimonadales bacterium]